MQVTVRLAGTVIVDNNVDTLNVDSTTEDIRRHQDALLESLESRVARDTERRIRAEHSSTTDSITYRSDISRPEWMLMLGKLHDTSSLSSSMQRETDLTKMTTWEIQIRLTCRKYREPVYLVELERIQKLVELSVLLDFFELDEVLLQAVQG
jgi:hypothetical protein